MSGIKRLRRVQFFQEAAATKGTTDEATSVQRVTGTVDDQRVMHFPDEDIGYLVDTERVSNPYKFAVLEIEEGPATFEQLGYHLCAGIKRLDTGTVDTGALATAFIWTFPFSFEEPVNDFSTYSIEAGDNEEMEVLPYSYLKSFKLSGRPKLPIMFSGTYEARQAERNKLVLADAVFVTGGAGACLITSVAAGLAVFKVGMNIRVEGAAVAGNNGTFTVTLSAAASLTIAEVIPGEGAVACTIQQDFTDSAALPDPEDIMFSKAALTINTEAVAFGNAAGAMTALMMSFDLEVETGIQARPAASGQLYFPRAALVNPSIVLRMTLEWNGDSSDEKQLWKDGGHVGRKIRIAVLGSAVTVAGDNHAYKTLFIDVAGQWEKFEKLGEDNGNDIVDVIFRGQYNTTATAFSTITLVTNVLAALPQQKGTE